ncbi:uncharacterized protein LOC121721062 isoform X2 [Alosa sapidissima]|uniref:uncharacterized protein LOC121721062 isoform X2 n=1 Tax=Alosa sapidissima TaxID=34773 RepID=UPI001C08F93A|nr:uncharacterized protein LOC121721062 isoform X2 [Alosa sapidissima]
MLCAGKHQVTTIHKQFPVVMEEIQPECKLAMSINDYCRLCKKYLRCQGILNSTKLIFEVNPTDKYGNILNHLSKLGITLHKTPLRSNRACRQCCNVIVRALRDAEILNKWRNQERQDEEPISNDKRVRDTAPQMPDQTKRHLRRCRKPSAKRMVDGDLFMECVEEELEPWQQIHENKEPERVTGKPAVVTRVLAPAPVFAPAPVASTHVVLSGQALSGNSGSSKDTVLSLLNNTPSLLTPMASVPVTALPSGFLLVVNQL